MKKSFLILGVLAAIGGVVGAFTFRQSDIRLKMRLEAAYERLLLASREGDESALKEAMASATFARVHNEEVARFGRFRKNRMRVITANTPDLSQYVFHGILHDGNRALLAYRPLDDSVMPRGCLLLRSFVYERGDWRVEQQDFLPAGRWLEKQPFRETVRQASYPENLKVDRPLAEAEELIAPPEVPAELYVRSPGYVTIIRINEREVVRVRDEIRRMYIPGGLRVEPNTIRVDAAPLPESDAIRREVNVVVNVFDAVGRSYAVFQYAPREEAPAPYEAVIRTDR